MTTTIFKGVTFVSGFFFKEHIPKIVHSAAYSWESLLTELSSVLLCDCVTANVSSDFLRALEWLINCTHFCCYYNCFVCFFVSIRD